MSGPIPVLHFSNALARGGAEEHILTLLRGLSREYFRLHLVCTPTVASLLEKDLPADVDVIPLALHRPQQAKAAWELAKILRDRRIQVLHSHLFYASLFASPVGRLSGVPVIIETTHIREQWRNGWLKSRFFVDRAVGRCVTHYIAVSQANADYLEGVKGLPAEKIHVIRNGSDLTRFHSRRGSDRLRTELGLAVGAPVLLVAGRLEPQKGHSVLLDALPKIRQEFPQVCAVFAGEGALQSQLQDQTNQLGLQSCVKFVGFQRNMQEWFSLADVKVLPSFFEGLPLVAVESLATGTPVVASAVDGTPEIVIHEKNGLTVPAGDPDALAQAICRLLASPELRKQYGEAGRRWVHQHFTQEEQIRNTEQLYLRALGIERNIPFIMPAEPKPESPDIEVARTH